VKAMAKTKRKPKNSFKNFSLGSLLPKISFFKKEDELVSLLKKIQFGDQKLYKKIQDGQELSHSESESIKKELSMVNTNLSDLKNSFQKKTDATDPISALIVDSSGKPIESQKTPVEVKKEEVKFSEFSSQVMKMIKENQFSNNQNKFLLEQVSTIASQNNIQSSSLTELKTFLEDQSQESSVQKENLNKVLESLQKDTELEKANISLEKMQAQLSALTTTAEDFVKNEKEQDKKNRLKDLKDKANKVLQGDGKAALASLLGVPLLEDLKGLGEVAKSTGELLKGVPGLATIGRFAAPAAIGTAIGIAIGETLINPLFNYFNKQRKQETDKKLTKLKKGSELLGSKSDSDLKQAQKNAEFIEKAAAAGLFGEDRKTLDTNQISEALKAFNATLEKGKSKDEALIQAIKTLNIQETAAKLKNKSTFSIFNGEDKAIQLGAMKRKSELVKAKSQVKDFSSSFEQASNSTAPGQESGIKALPSSSAVYREQVLNELKSPTSSKPQAQVLSNQLGFKYDSKTATGNTLVDLLKSMEGFEPTAAPDPVGIPTIGYGHALLSEAEVRKYRGVTLSETEATELLKKDIDKHQQGAIKELKVPVSSEQMAALTLFAFNAGAQSPGLKQMVSFLNQGKEKEAADVFLKYTKATDRSTGEKKELKGLVKRRGLESALFLAGSKNSNPTTSSFESNIAEVPSSISNSSASSSTSVSNPIAEPQSLKPAMKSDQMKAAPAPISRPSPNPVPASQSMATAPGTKKVEISDLSLAILKNGMLDGV